MEEKRCSHCGSDGLIPYTFRPPQQRKDGHKCSVSYPDAPLDCPDCTVIGTMCLNCRIVKG